MGLMDLKIERWGDKAILGEWDQEFVKGPVLKSFMRQFAIIEAHEVPWKFWIL